MKRRDFIKTAGAIGGVLASSNLFATSHIKRIDSVGLMAFSTKGEFAKTNFTRHAIGDNDILIDILYAGICHSDIHSVLGHWGNFKTLPYVPGHEIAGVVSAVGKSVKRFKVGDFAGVGCLVNSCRICDTCKDDEEQYCENRTLTYGQKDIYHNDELTQGGYSNNIVLSEDFAIKVPQNAQMDKVAPLLCAGITVYSPIEYLNIKKGDSVGVAGFGGLGHMGVKYLVAKGAKVTIFDIVESKREDAKRMGAVAYYNMNNENEIKSFKPALDYIINTIPSKHDANMYVKMLKKGGEMAYVGLPAFNEMPSISLATFVFDSKRKVFGSQIGGIKQTQEMLDFSVANNIYPEVQLIEANVTSVQNAYQNVLDGNVKFRYVIDMKTL